MKHAGLAILALAAAWTLPAQAQSNDPAPALNQPDLVSWQLFAMVNAPAASANNNNVLFETWASDDDTFPPTGVPVWPATPSPMALRVPALIRFAPVEPGLGPRVLPDGSEETRRNRATFDFIKNNNLYKKSGLRAAFAAGKEITFPTDSVEVKANWTPIEQVTNPANYHVNTTPSGKRFALVSMHIISKQIPNWTWATFEHQENKGRCDYIGCKDNYGAVVPFVAPEPVAQFGKVYPACQKTPAALAILNQANLEPAFKNYCLKGSQIDFITPSGIATLLGNSVTEDHFDNTSSCITCHSRAAFDAAGNGFVPGAGFVNPPIPALCPRPNSNTGPRCSPSGSPQPSWFYNNPGTPQQARKYLQADFVWAIPLLAQDD